MNDILNPVGANPLFDPEPTRRTDIPSPCFLAILNYGEDAQKFQKLCTEKGVFLRVLGGNVLLVFSYDSIEETGRFLKIFGHPQYEFALAAMGEVQNF